MGSSLKELLAEEGFKERMIMTKPRSSFGLESVTMPLPHRRSYDSRPGVKIGTERTRSDVSRFNIRNGSSKSQRFTGRIPRDNIVTKEKPDGLKKEIGERIRERGMRNIQEGKKASVNDVDGFHESKIFGVEKKEDDQFKDIYSDEVYSSKRDIKKDRLASDDTTTNLFGRASFSTNHRQSTNEYDLSHGTSNKSLGVSKSFGDKRSRRRVDNVEGISEPALDEVAVQAVISILTGHIKHFRKDNEFRLSLRESCFSSFFSELEEGNKMERKIISNLEQAIEILEIVAEESANAKELKRASLQLSIITGLNSNDKKDGFTCGVPNVKLSACAHIYLSVIYKLQKRDKLSAKHLLQVFCDSPFQARTALLPELWDYLFYPHLTHLKAWYNQEVKGFTDTPSRPRKLKHLQKVYNEVMDSGTHMFAIYYKDWLTDGVEAPSIPSIHTPSVYVRGIQQVGSYGYFSEQASPANLNSSQATVSKKLYDAVFTHASKFGVANAEDDMNEDNCHSFTGTSYGSVVEDKEVVTDSLEAVTDSLEAATDTNQDMMDNSTEHAHHNASQIPIDRRSSTEELHEVCEYKENGSITSSVPREFICPLTKQLFEDPVTLETGQTFERAAVMNWFDEGNRTCPITGKTLGRVAVPLTNFVLKRFIDNWKYDQYGINWTLHLNSKFNAI